MSMWHRCMTDKRYGYPGEYSVFRCPACGVGETYPHLPASCTADAYSLYYPRLNTDLRQLQGQVDDPTTTWGKLKIWLKGTGNQGHYLALPGMRVLDYGCGAGTSLMELEKLGADGYGIEVDRNVRRIASHFGLRIHVGSLDESPFAEIKFDLICLNQAIEHIPDPANLLTTLNTKLSPSGTLALSFPNTDSIYRRMCGRRWINWHVPYHLHHFSLRSFTRFCDQHGWHVVQHRTITPTVWTILQLRTAFTPETASTDDSIWQSSSSSLLKRGAMLIAVAGITLVNRVVDAVGMGDSLLVVIRPSKPGRASDK